MLYPSRRPDFDVKYRFFSEKEGGRKSGPPRQGWRCPWAYEKDLAEKPLQVFDIFPEFEDNKGGVLPELRLVPIEGIARMYILDPKLRIYHKQRIQLGTKGYFMEIGKAAEAVVIRIVGLSDVEQVI
jgi:hypothetical protein